MNNQIITPTMGLNVAACLLPGFPYKQKFCPYCEREIPPANALHLVDYPEVFKVAYVCENPDCGAFEEEAQRAYVKEYYSCEEAFTLLQPIRVLITREQKQ